LKKPRNTPSSPRTSTTWSSATPTATRAPGESSSTDLPARRGLLLGLLLAPFWINYLMRMLAWVNLLQEDGYVNDAAARFGIDRASWLDGRPLTVIMGLAYGYVPFLILPLFAALDRIDQRVLEASRDLGMGPARTFWRVTLPMSRQGILAAGVITALPMMGDYYTADLLSGSPRTSMVGNQIEFYLFEGSQKNAGASLVVVLSVFLMVAMAYYMWSTDRATRELR
jgi:spermidine/putrescine transport system permease protein